jgi:trk system potassium uptake protein TrkA
MKVVILGAGRRGIRLARHLVDEQKDVIIIDHRASEIEKAMTSVDCLGIVVSGTDAADLKNADLDDADAFIALTGSDEINLVSCGIMAAHFKVPVTIAAVRSLSYSEKGKGINLLGISHIVNPSQEVAKHIYDDISRGLYSDILSFENSSIVMYNVSIDSDSTFKDRKLIELRSLIPGQYIVAALRRGGDTLSITLSEDTAEEMLNQIGKRREKPKKIAIIGATMVTDFLLHQFTKRQQKHITVIAKDTAECEELALKYPDVLVINENITNAGVFRQENLESYDLLLSATDNDELNVIIASYAKHYGVKGTIALISKNQDYIQMADHMGIDNLLSAQDITVDSIVKFLQGKNITNTQTMFDGKLEALVYTVPEKCPIKGMLLKDINMKGNGLIVGAQKKDGTNILPGGNYLVEEGDRLILVLERSNLAFIQKLLNIEGIPG